MSENKLKHLEFIQNAITRMSANSFLVKGWSITLFSALLAFVQKDKSTDYLSYTYFAVPLFWYLNGYFLLQERRFRELYNSVRTKQDNQIDFSMDTDSVDCAKCTLIRSLFASTIWPLYVLMFAIVLLFMFQV